MKIQKGSAFQIYCQYQQNQYIVEFEISSSLGCRGLENYAADPCRPWMEAIKINTSTAKWESLFLHVCVEETESAAHFFFESRWRKCEGLDLVFDPKVPVLLKDDLQSSPCAQTFLYLPLLASQLQCELFGFPSYASFSSVWRGLLVYKCRIDSSLFWHCRKSTLNLSLISH